MDGTKNYIRLKCVLVPRATNLLRKLFYENWQISNSKWKNCAEQGLMFITGEAHNLHSSVNKRKQELLHSGNVNVWDMKLLGMVLLKLDINGDMTTKANDKNNLTQLLDLHREIELVSHCSIDSDKFDLFWERMKKLMILLGDSSEALAEIKTLENLEECEKASDDEDVDIINVLRAKGFKEVANAFYKAGKYTEAIESYTEGINLSNLTREDLGTLYSNRSAVYMVAAETNLLSELLAMKLAKYDAKRVLELRPLWFRGHYRLGCAYRFAMKYQKAIIHFAIAMYLDPKHQEISEELNECKLRLQEEKFSNSIYPEKMPENNVQMAEEIGRQFGTRMSEEFFLALEERLTKLGDPRPLVWQAHRYIAGCNVEQDCLKAAEMYTKAAQMGNAEGMYNLAVLHREGRGVRRDLKQSLKLLRQAASKPRMLEGIRNVGVAEAEFGIGLAYEKGWGLAPDLSEAVNWYVKASEHGNKHAANTLACFHFYGRGVEQNDDKAVQYWKLAALRHNVIAMQSLANHYMDNEEDLDKALYWHRRAVAAGNLHAKSISAAFEAQIYKDKGLPKPTDISNCDDQPMDKYPEDDQPMDEKVDTSNEKIQPADSETTVRNSVSDEAVALKNPVYDDKVLQNYASEGSRTALNLLQAVKHFTNANNLVKHKHAFLSVVIPELANCIRICEKVIDWDAETKKNAIAVVSRALRILPNKDTCHLEKDARICYLALHEMPVKDTFSFLEESIHRYPDEVWFHIVLCNLLGMTKDNEKGAEESTKALKNFPDNCDLLFTLACHLQALRPTDITARNSQEIIAAFEHFLTTATPDHKKVPQAYYSIALEYLLCSEKKPTRERNMRMILNYYRRGLEAEKVQLPFYLPYACDKKSYLESLPAMQSLFQGKDIVVANGTEKDKDGATAMTKLCDPRRIDIIKEHRETMADFRSPTEEGPVINKMYLTPCQFDQMRPITLKDMDCSRRTVYAGFALFVVVIEEPLLGSSGIHLVVEDENGDAERMCVYNFPQNEDVHAKLGLGCTLTVLNPNYRMSLDDKAVLQVDHMSSVIFESGQNLSRCHYCGRSGSVLKCGKCMRAVYCSKMCQINDWKVLNHKLVCMNY